MFNTHRHFGATLKQLPTFHVEHSAKWNIRPKIDGPTPDGHHHRDNRDRDNRDG